jgi:endonuclease/exonuclease/phosphatase family metal-dependent hydrolase
VTLLSLLDRRADPNMKLRVMSYNIRGQAAARSESHIEGIAEAIKRLQPDLVGLQEVHRFTAHARARDQAQELAERTSLRLQFGRCLEGWGGEYGNAVLSRFPIVTHEVHALPGSGEPRAVLECRLFAGAQFELSFFVAHLEAWGFLRRATRAAQLHRLAEITREAHLPWILTGDFNAVPSAGEIREFLAKEHLQLCGEHRERSFRYSLQRLDYMLADRRWHTTSCQVQRIGPSDHWPLVAELEYR